MRIYLAGPDVFLPAPERRRAALTAVCARHGHEGVWPLDPPPLAPDEVASLPEARRIALGNEAHIRSCAALVANLTPFRGPNTDPGTAFEIGFARMLGLKLAGWTNDARCLATRTRAWLGVEGERDREGLLVEDFGLTENLMLEGAILASGGVIVRGEVAPARRWDDITAFERCLAAL